MDQTTGRGRHEAAAGSITVADLLARHAAAAHQVSMSPARLAPLLKCSLAAPPEVWPSRTLRAAYLPFPVPTSPQPVEAPPPALASVPTDEQPVRTTVQLMPEPKPEQVTEPVLAGAPTPARSRPRVSARCPADRSTEPQTATTRLRRGGRAMAASGIAAVLIGSLGAAAMATAPARTASAPPGSAQAGGDVSGVGGVAAPSPRPAQPQDVHSGRPQAPTTDAPTASAAPRTEGPSAVPPPPVPPTDLTPTVEQIVRDHLRAAAVRPESLIGSVLSLADTEAFRPPWGGVQAVDIAGITREADGQLHVAAIVTSVTGQRVHTEHLLTVADDRQPHVVDSTLLSVGR